MRKVCCYPRSCTDRLSRLLKFGSCSSTKGAHVRTLNSFRLDTSGNFAVALALSTTAIVGAAGFGLDTYRLENTRTTLDQVVGLTCDRIENADYALYPSKEARLAMAKKFAAENVKQSKLDRNRTTFEVKQSADKISVKGSTKIDATLMKIMGYGELSGVSSRDCTPPSSKPPAKACSKDDLIFLNPGNFKLAAGTMIAGSKNYTATLYDAKGNIKARQIVGNGSGETEVFLKSTVASDLVVVQPFNGDGTTPAACNPTIACDGDTKTCPAADPTPKNPVCTREKAWKLGKTFNPPYAMGNPGWTMTKQVNAYISNNRLVYKDLSIDLTQDFAPEVMWTFFPSYYLNRRSNMNFDVGMFFIDNLQQGGMYSNGGYNKVHAKLYRIINYNAAVWEYGPYCVFSVSPIILDLTGKGEIATTGVSGARYPIPQHGVNATVEFDMLGTGKPVSMEWLPGNGQALLVDNRDGKAASDMNGKRLFGSVDGFDDGYRKLATLDQDGDGKLTSGELSGLSAWIDNGNAKVEEGELKPLADVGISELSTKMTKTPTGDGGTHMRSTAIMNGKPIMTEDVWFAVDLTANIAKAASSNADRMLK